MGLGHTHGSPNLGQKTRLYNNNNLKEKRICKIVDFAVLADHRIKLKECEKKNKYLDLARELKKQWNMKVTIIPIVIGAFGTVTKGLLKGLEDLKVSGWVETTLTTARILRRVLETWGHLLSLKLILYESRREVGRGLESNEVSVDASIQKRKDYIIKMPRKTDYSDQKQYRHHQHQQNKNNPKTKMGSKNKRMDIFSDKQPKSHTRKLGYR